MARSHGPVSLAGIVAANLASLILLAGAASAELPPLIPRSAIWSNPSFAGMNVSPDGRWISYHARSKGGVMTVHVRPVGGGADQQLTNDRTGDVFGAEWAPDSRHMLFYKANGGDENWHLMSVELGTGQVRDLTPFQGVRAATLLDDSRHPREVLIGMNLRDRRTFDMYRLNLETGAITLDTVNPGDVTEWAVDSALVIRGCVALDSTNSNTVIRVRDGRRSPWRTLQVWPFMKAGQDRDQRIVEFSRDGRSVLLLSPVGSRTTRFLSVDVKTGAVRDSLPADPRADVWCPFNFVGEFSPAAVMLDHKTGAVQAYMVDYLRPEWRVLDPSLRRDFDALAKVRGGVMTPVSRDDADRYWAVIYYDDMCPGAYYLWDRKTQRAESLFVSVPELARYQLARMQAITLRSRDGHDIPCYLTLPDGIPPKKLPLIMHPHGGPWARDEWGFDPEVQWLANRGYAVIQPQFRGSTGFGVEWINASVGEVGAGAMTQDLADVVRWAVAQGIADSTRVGIFGGSYGGYATLCGLAFTPELYTCGVDVVGPSSLRTTIASFPPYWKARQKRWLLRMGDVLADTLLNQRVSPLYHTDRMRAPLLIGHGANDPRVNIAESVQITAALRKRNVPVTFVVYPDEGHGFARPENNQDFNGRMEDFLAKHLRGRAEPWRKVEGSSAQVR